jgi:hypothetical protein
MEEEEAKEGEEECKAQSEGEDAGSMVIFGNGHEDPKAGEFWLIRANEGSETEFKVYYLVRRKRIEGVYEAVEYVSDGKGSTSDILSGKWKHNGILLVGEKPDASWQIKFAMNKGRSKPPHYKGADKTCTMPNASTTIPKSGIKRLENFIRRWGIEEEKQADL